MSTVRNLVIACILGVPALASAATSRVDSLPPFNLPYVTEIEIGPAPRAGRIPGPICPDDSIQVRIAGIFPTPCLDLVRVDVIPPPYASPRPASPWIRLVVSDSCHKFCPEVLKAFHTSVVLPPLPASFYAQRVQLQLAVCPDSINPPPDSLLYETDVAFDVDPCDSIAAGCLAGDWERGEDSTSFCNAVVGPNRPAQIIFNVSSDVDLAGLQGEFSVYPPGLVITDIHTTGPALGMHLTWTPTSYGAKFNLFDEIGAPIPGDSVPPPNRHPPVPVLALVFEQRTAQVAPVTYVRAMNLFGSDINGFLVPGCAFPTLRFAAVEARICAEPSCDFNADGVADVRDLVLMAHCTFMRSDSTRNLCAEGMKDCNHDGRKSLEDVICCALEILRGEPCYACTLGTSRPAPDVHVSLGDPTFSASGVEMTLRVNELGAPQVGGAVLRLEYPDDRYLAELSVPANDPAWLTLPDVYAGKATVGLVRLSQAFPAFTNVPEMKLRLTLRPGRTHGGSVKLSSAEFSGPDGVRLETPVTQLNVALGGAPRMALSEARPNPFSGETRFRLTIDRQANVNVGIYDLSGRRIAMLHRGELQAGEHDFTWDGTLAGGAAAPGGVYFYRALAGSVTVSRKMVMLGR